MAGASIKQERIESGWIFSDGYYTATQTIAVPEDSDIASFEDLRGTSVAVKNGTAGADYAESLKDEYGFTITYFDDSPTMYQDVIIGNSSACFEDTPVMLSYIKQKGIALKVPEGLESEGSPYALAIMNRGRPGVPGSVQCRPGQHQGQRNLRRNHRKIPGVIVGPTSDIPLSLPDRDFPSPGAHGRNLLCALSLNVSFLSHPS